MAAIDVGTNTVLLLIARVRPDGSLSVIEDLCATPRLGEGVARTGYLAASAVERTMSVLRDYARSIANSRVDRVSVRAVGTAVLRAAADAPDFLRRVAAETGIAIEVVPPEEEARLAYLAVAPLGDRTGPFLIDVGGGSTEVVGPGGSPRFSAPIGALGLTEAHLGSATPGGEGWRSVLEEVERACRAFPAGGAQGARVVAVGGTALNLAALVAGFPGFDPVAAEGVEFDAHQATAWASQLARMSGVDRIRLPIEPSRAEILPAGLACLAGALNRIGADRVRASGIGLRFGLARVVGTR